MDHSNADLAPHTSFFQGPGANLAPRIDNVSAPELPGYSWRPNIHVSQGLTHGVCKYITYIGAGGDEDEDGGEHEDEDDDANVEDASDHHDDDGG